MAQPLTFQQWKDLKSKGLSNEMIVKFEHGYVPKLNPVEQLSQGVQKVGQFSKEFLTPQRPVSTIQQNLPTINPILKSLQLQENAQKYMQERPGAPYGFNLVAGPVLRTARDLGLSRPTTMAGGAAIGPLLNPALQKVATSQIGRQFIQKQLPTLGKELLQETQNLPVRYGSLKQQLMPTNINKTIDTAITKAIRPSVSGKKSMGQVTKYYDKARMAINTIYNNKSELQFIDEAGQVTNKLPESLSEFSSAIEQTKNKVFNTYNNIANQAGEQGAFINLNPIAQEIEKVASNKTISTLYPEVKNYALQKAEALKQTGQFTAQEAQDAIKMMNNSLKAFYKNPSFDTATRAEIDAGIANNMRKALDNSIESLTGQQYQVLKNQYSALKSIESDVNHRYIVNARRNVKGLIDFTDVFSGGQMVRGILTLNPAEFATGVAQKGIANFIKRLNDPDRIIKNMFRVIEKVNR